MGLRNSLDFVFRHPLSRGRKLANLRRLLAWQIASRLERKLCVAFGKATRTLPNTISCVTMNAVKVRLENASCFTVQGSQI